MTKKGRVELMRLLKVGAKAIGLEGRDGLFPKIREFKEDDFLDDEIGVAIDEIIVFENDGRNTNADKGTYQIQMEIVGAPPEPPNYVLVVPEVKSVHATISEALVILVRERVEAALEEDALEQAAPKDTPEERFLKG